MNQFAITVLIVTAVIDFGLAALLFASMRRHPARYWFCAVLLGLAFWSFGIAQFLSLGDGDTQALAWVREYYIAAASISLALLGFSLWFPRRIVLSRRARALIGLGYGAMCVNVLSDGGLIGNISLEGLHVVTLRPLPYLAFAVVFVAFCAASLTNLFRGEYFARSKHRRHLVIQMRLVIFGAVISLIGGCWFNLILPAVNNYQFVWVGPLCTLSFTFTVMFAIARQGLFDVRQALVRTSGFVLIIAVLVLVYAGLLYATAQLFFNSLFQSFWGTATLQLVLALFVALTIAPLRRQYDRIALRAFYSETYDDETVVDTLRRISQREIKTDVLVAKSLQTLAAAVKPNYIIAYIIEPKGHIRTYSIDSDSPTGHQRAIQREIVEHHITDLPTAGHVYDIDHLRRSTAFQLLTSARVGAFIRLDAQGEAIGMIFLGRRHNEGSYYDRDLRLFDAIRNELALSIQNTQRFREIEQFTATLEQRVQTATKELRSSNAKLQRLDAAKDEFVSMASHQLRTPLTSVKGYISMVLEGDAGDISPMQKKLLSEAFTSSERMVHLISDFLNVSRLQTGKFMVESRAVDLPKIVGQEVDSLRTTAEAHALKLAYRQPTYFPLLYLDEAKIRQVVMNFIDNAIYYSPEHSTIAVKLSHRGGEAVLEVVDDGIGVPQAEQPHLFTKFFRAENARKQRPDGTGVGLFLAKKVIDAHGGDIIFHSTEGQGSTFGFRLPIGKLSVPPAKTD